MGMYEKGDFYDPVVRCAQCSKIVHRRFIDQHGGCNHCGNRRFSNVTGLDEKEYLALQAGKYNLGIEDYHLDNKLWDEWIQDWERAE